MDRLGPLFIHISYMIMKPFLTISFFFNVPLPLDWLGHSIINYAFHTCSRKHLLQFQYGFYFQCSTSHGPVGSLMIYTLYRAGPHKERTEPLRAVATRFFKLRSLTIINLLLIPYIRLSITQQ